MSNAIILPPLPFVPGASAMSKTDEDHLHELFRARDLEVARLVLEGAAKFFRENDSLLFWGSQAASHIKEIEVKHHE